MTLGDHESAHDLGFDIPFLMIYNLVLEIVYVLYTTVSWIIPLQLSYFLKWKK